MTPLHVLRPVLVRAGRTALEGRFTRDEVTGIVDDAFRSYEERRGQLPVERSAGGRLMVHLAALTIAFYRALEARGVDPPEARELTARMTWRVYRRMAVVPDVAARMLVRSREERLRKRTALFRRFPFGPPAYRMEDVDAGQGVVAFDVRRCPVAEVFRAEDLGELCVASWCDLDFPLAERWDATLSRDRTLAGGGDRCTFRWRVASGPPAEP